MMKQIKYPFTLQELQYIIDHTLGMYKYFDVLASLLGDSPQGHIREHIEVCLSSKEFIQKVHPYMNRLLTTTNIAIIVAALKIYAGLETPYSKSKAMNRVKYTVNIFTVFQMETNATNIECDLSVINNVFSKIGLIARKQQFQFYLKRCWEREEEGCLQIAHLLPLAIEIDEIQVLKGKLSKWISSDEYAKRFLRNRCRSSLQAKKLQKIKISYLRPYELLHEIQKHQLILQISAEIKNLRNCFKKPFKQGQEIICKDGGQDPKEEDEKVFLQNMLNGIYVYDNIKDELKQGKAMLMEHYKPRFNSWGTQSKVDTNEMSDMIKSALLVCYEKNKISNKLQNEPFRNIGNKIFR